MMHCHLKLKGYVVASVEENGLHDLSLIKYFSPSNREAWTKEVSIVSGLNTKGIEQDNHPNLLSYRWHSLGTYNIGI
jgi:hypothetical protein